MLPGVGLLQLLLATLLIPAPAPVSVELPAQLVPLLLVSAVSCVMSLSSSTVACWLPSSAVMHAPGCAVPVWSVTAAVLSVLMAELRRSLPSPLKPSLLQSQPEMLSHL